MAQIKIRRGTDAELIGVTLNIGELGYTTDNKKLYIGNGVSNTFIGASILDEDDLVSNSSISLATQQSIKKYIDDNNIAHPSDSLVAQDITDIGNLSGVNTGDETKVSIDALNVDADTVDTIHAASFVRNDNGSQTIAGSVVLGGTSTFFQALPVSSYDKFRVWNANTFTIGMHESMSFGYVADYAMTFTMDSTANRGFVWRDSSDVQTDGAMSLNTFGELSVKKSVSIGNTGTECTVTFNATDNSIDFIIN